MALTVEETRWFDRLSNQLAVTKARDGLYVAYYEGAQRLEHIGLAVPPALRRFETLVNWPRLVVGALEERLDIKSLILPGEDVADEGLRELWEANDLDSDASLVHLDALIFGRAFVSIGANEDDPGRPLIRPESPREVAVKIDPRSRRVVAALRLYADEEDLERKFATLYLPNVTVWLESGPSGWTEVDRDEHKIGRVPMVPFYNQRRTGRTDGMSEINDAIHLTDAAARALTNLQVAAETHSVPQKWVLGMSKGDFVGPDGEPVPAWQAYFSAIWANSSKDAKVGQFSASDLRNFHETVNFYGGLLSGVYGLPMRYVGQNTANPPSADGIRADEARLIKRAERKQSSWGNQWGRVAAFGMRYRDGVWPDGNRIRVEWHDAGTPTFAAKVDGIQKMTGGQPILSREGGWDELGWSEARKDRERAYFDREASDPTLERVARELVSGGAVADERA